MTAESISKLLEVSHSLYQVQEKLKKVFGCAYLEQEIEGILMVILSATGNIEQSELINDQFRNKFLELCSGVTSKEEFLRELIQQKEKLNNQSSCFTLEVEMLNKLIEVVTEMNHKRGLIKSVFRGENYFLNQEKEAIKAIVLEELGDRRSF